MLSLSSLVGNLSLSKPDVGAAFKVHTETDVRAKPSPLQASSAVRAVLSVVHVGMRVHSKSVMSKQRGASKGGYVALAATGLAGVVGIDSLRRSLRRNWLAGVRANALRRPLFVKILNPTRKQTIALASVTAYDTILSIKEQIARREPSWTPQNQRLIFAGKILEDACTLSDYGDPLEEGTVQLLVLAPGEGGWEKRRPVKRKQD